MREYEDWANSMRRPLLNVRSNTLLADMMKWIKKENVI